MMDDAVELSSAQVALTPSLNKYCIWRGEMIIECDICCMCVVDERSIGFDLSYVIKSDLKWDGLV